MDWVSGFVSDQMFGGFDGDLSSACRGQLSLCWRWQPAGALQVGTVKLISAARNWVASYLQGRVPVG